MTPATSSVIFLDFDGVLNNNAHVKAVRDRRGITTWEQYLDTFAPWCPLPPCGLTARVLDTVYAAELLERPRCALVQRLCQDTGAAIVVVSSWRRYAYGEELQALLHNAGLTAPVLGAVGGLKMSCELRARAISEWLSQNPDVTAWAVLDDDTKHYMHDKKLQSRAVHPVDGVTVEDCEAVRAILRRFDGGHGDARGVP